MNAQTNAMPWKAITREVGSSLGLMLLVLVCITAILLYFTHLSLWLAIDIEFGIFVTVSLLCVNTMIFYQRMTRGRLQLDCGPHPRRWIFLTGGCVISGIGIDKLCALGTGWHMLSMLSWATGLFMYSLFMLALAFGRLQIVEHGIWYYCSLWRWKGIEAYHWDNNNLIIVEHGKKSSVLGLFGRGVITISPEYREAVEALVQQHLGPEGERQGAA